MPNQPSKIDAWLRGLERDDRAAFFDYCEASGGSGKLIHGYLLEHGCQVGQTSAYAWSNNNIPKGSVAIAINSQSKDYRGVDLTAMIEQLLVRTYKVTEKYYEALQRHDDSDSPIPLTSLMASLPQMLREMRAMVDQVSTLRTRTQNEVVSMDVAARFRELLITEFQDQDDLILRIVEQACTVAMMRLKEEYR